MADTADTIHTDAIVLDAHNDAVMRRIAARVTTDLTVPHDGFHTDLARLDDGGIDVLFSCSGITDLAQALQALEAIHRMTHDHPGHFALARSTRDILDARERHAVALVAQLESLSCCMGSLEALSALYRLGVRVAGLTHGEAPEHGCQKTPTNGGYCTPEDRQKLNDPQYGLTEFGRAAIRRMNDLGIVVDLAHATDAAFYEAIELSATPPIFSHGTVFALCPHYRGLTDNQISALADAGGVHGVTAFTKFIHRQHPDIEALVDLIEYSIDLVGPEHVGIGTDYDGLPDDEVPVPPHPGELPNITAEMASRGWQRNTIQKVLGLNFLRVLREVIG